MEAARLCASLSFTVLIILVGAVCNLSATATFCSRALARKACPVPPTFDSVAIDSYLGKWYEIGSTAMFKFRNEIGDVCVQANYSLSSSSSIKAGPGLNISLINSDLRVIGPSSSLGVSLISGAARQVCSSARKTCSLVAGDSELQNAADQITSVVRNIQSRHSQEASISILSRTANQIVTTLSNVQSGLNFVANMISRIQMVNSRLSQNANKSSASSISTLKDLVRKAAAELSTLEVEVINLSIATAHELQMIVDSLLIDQDTASVSKIIQASFWIDEGKVAVISNLQLIRLSLDGLANNVPLLFSLDQIATNYSSYANVSYVRGNAIQKSVSAAKLEVTIRGFSGPYWILDLVGQAKDGYTASLVYGCVEDEQGEIREDVFILARNWNLSVHVIDRLMQIVESSGINTDCEDPFLYTTQLGGDCGAPPLTSTTA